MSYSIQAQKKEIMIQQSRDFKEQLAPVAAKLREGQSLIRPISQITLRLKPTDGKDRFASTIDQILRWMNRRAGRALPTSAWQRESFELSDIGAQRAAAVSLYAPQYWAARLDDADKSVPLRTWVTEIGVGADSNGDVLFGARLLCVTRGADLPFDRSIPGFARAILTAGPAELDGRVLGAGPTLISSEKEVNSLVQLLENPQRQADVIVFALPDGVSDPTEAAASAKAVYDATIGAAHVFVITGPASFFLTDSVGRELSVFRRAARIYRPGFQAWTAQPSNHPLILPNRISEWDSEGPAAFERWITNQVLGSSIRGPAREERLPSFNSVRQYAAEVDRRQLKTAGGSDSELLKLFEEENDRLRKALKEQREQSDGLLVVADDEREAAMQAANAAKAQALERLYRIRALQQRLNESSGQADVPIPETLDTFEDWCHENLAGTVEVSNRAFQGARKSNYYDPQFIYRVLLLLRDYYVPMRVEGTSERRKAYEAALQDLELEDSLTGDGVKYAPDLYSIQYGDSRRALDRHLKGRNSRDRRYGFRLYFFWDDEGQVAVVGWLPSHLDNRAS